MGYFCHFGVSDVFRKFRGYFGDFMGNELGI